MDYNRYKSYATEDFLLDENFIKLVNGNSADGCTLNQLKNHLPEKSEEISLAIGILNELKTKKRHISIEQKEETLNAVYQSFRHQIRLKIFRYAAAVLLFAGTGTSAFFILNKQSDIEDFVSSSDTRSEKAELILADGKRIEIDSKQSKIEYAANSASVSLNDTATLEQSEPVNGNSFNQIIIPFGKRSDILLSDGTKVQLNSGSKLVYPPVFRGKSREVFVEGEAYFEVSENKNRPFFVRTESFRIKVLGTKFVVQAYKNEEEHNTILVEGKVSLTTTDSKTRAKTYELSPNQKATFSENKNDFSISTVDNVESYIAWIHGYLNFENEDLISLTKRISRYYNVNIEINTQNINSTFSGKLDLKEEPERILNGLSIIFKTKYEKRGDKFVFYE
ncbi:MAG: hypothetical protein A2W90_03795 [Bacteroidetes bacterium GWF2_42_66]|nr:MAG: hypothetical protein A2W92_18715 [Bacteroidetes bacterium GWA2_42_15]OFY02550.1 MAG: hypothetical protein A2W89_22055 [Bacteroidetes bacterium GWE2_42_39]OFY41351.1 MAG: hypothetical protein A2W90_03795 [Bacteroidetes bacterium GWF2_42_66]HBL75449.1 hypothetical protein [Prolixibacteraceae bacterium]HCR91462.1 hypothetical protein [Prolixibacteraceae bacterium]